jgi:hypothetical protein
MPPISGAARATNRDGQRIALQTIVLELVSIRHVHSVEVAMLEYFPSDRTYVSCIQQTHLTQLHKNPTPTLNHSSTPLRLGVANAATK